MLREDLVRKKLKLLKPFIGEKAERIWLAYCASNPMDRRSWETKVDILVAKYLETSEEDSVLEIIPPEFCSGDYCSEGGVHGQALVLFCLEKESLLKHLGIFSQTGSGKTNLANTRL
jgi:hypothetical protein